jgi:hypothetical protein
VKKILLIFISLILVWTVFSSDIIAADPTPKTEPVPVNNELCPNNGTVYPPNSDCYSLANKFEVQEVDLSGGQFFSYPLSCITAPAVSYKETYIDYSPPPSTRTVSVTSDISEAQLGFLGPDSTTLATSNPDSLAKKYLFNSLFDRPSTKPNAEKESFRTFWRMLDSLSQAQLKAFFLENTDNHTFYYVGSDNAQHEVSLDSLNSRLPNCLKKFSDDACWQNSKYVDDYLSLGPTERDEYDALLPFDFNNMRSYIVLGSTVSKENIPYLGAILDGLKGQNTVFASVPGLFDYYTPGWAVQSVTKHLSAPANGVIETLQYPSLMVRAALSSCSVPAKSTSLSSPKTYPNISGLSQTVTVPVSSVLISSTPDQCLCEIGDYYCNRYLDCESYANNQTSCVENGCLFEPGQDTYELTGNATGKHLTVFNNPYVDTLNDLVVGGKDPIGTNSNSPIVSKIAGLVNDVIGFFSKSQPSFYKMLLPSFAPDPEKTLVSAPSVNTSTGNPNAAVSGSSTIYRENNLAQDTMHLLQNCWLVPSDQQSSSKCGLLSAVSSPANCDVNAPENSSIGISKDTFAGIADRWSNPSNQANECFNDVINRSLCAGIDPRHTLLFWLHESGASNYTLNWLGPVEDFGIHMAGISPENFNEQITRFLQLDPGAHCQNDPLIAGDYWLGLITNMLNGHCDPDEINQFGTSGRSTLPDFIATWEILFGSTPMPSTIHISPGGQNCP